jgi:type IV pilus assembly protein PilV
MLMKFYGRAHAGFSMLEVLVTITVISLALLGIAKMQAAGTSGTQISRAQSLVAMQADSLAAAMHSNRGFWAAGSAPPEFGASSPAGTTTIYDASSKLTGATSFTGVTTSCLGITASCSPVQTAAYDVMQWASNLSGKFPAYAALVDCNNAVTPVTCKINITWTENNIAINKTAVTTSPTQASFTLLVQP